MLKMRLAVVCGLLVVLCLSFQSTRAEEAGKAEPTPEGEPPASEPEPGKDEDSKGSGKPAKSEKQGTPGGNGASALGITFPAIIALVSAAKFIL